ncbi:MAG: hypothetical protein RLZ98_1626 [Pseudomonadota bacterium]|jgi:putative acyl-CoA dehydrogenase
MVAGGATHEVLNQSESLVDIDLFASDLALREAVEREGVAIDTQLLTAHGRQMGSAEAFDAGLKANKYPPRLETHDSRGRRIDIVEYHPAYHRMMELGTVAGLHCSGFDGAGAHVRRAAKFYMTAQVEPGHCCPLTMTNASLAVLGNAGAAFAPWVEKIRRRSYDPFLAPLAEKAAITVGMGMTEKQGGSDVRANTTLAVPDPGDEGCYLITGHKWFMSAPMSDAFVVLAQAPGGLTCFLVPRVHEDGARNGIRLQRLKDKLGNRSNASAECEFAAASGWRIGAEGEGGASIIQMVLATRLDCAVSSAALMRRSVAMAIHHCRQRQTFGQPLTAHPIMQHVLADLVLDVEAAVALSFRLARSFDLAGDERAAAWRRLMTPVTKFWVCKVAPVVISEALECLGGNGYVEENGAALLYREAPVNSIWEGAGNIMALDVLRVLQREPDVVETVLEDIEAVVGADVHLKGGLDRVREYLHEPRLIELRARGFVEALATLAAASLLRAHAPQFVSDAFIAARLYGHPRQTYGQGLERLDVRPLIERAVPG